MPDTEIVIRRVEQLTPTVIAQLADVLIAVVEQGASVGFLPPLDRDEAEGYWSQALEPGVVLLVAEQADTIVGTAQLQGAMRPNGRHRAEVAKVLVQPSCQRLGIGRHLMLAIEHEARKEGRSLLVLDTRAGDASNQLYRSMGYVEVGLIPGYARSTDGHLAATVFYFKQLCD